MAVSIASTFRAVVLVALFPAVLSGEVFSDLGDLLAPSPQLEQRALEAKAERFWALIHSAAEVMKVPDHRKLYDDVDQVISQLPAENTYVHEALREAVLRLRAADEVVLQQAVEGSAYAAGKLNGGTAGGYGKGLSSVFSGAQSFVRSAVRHFLRGGQYTDMVEEQVAQRQEEVLPVLGAAAQSTGSILTDLRLTSKRAFDVMKYDLYNKGVPKTPQSAKDVADRLVDASTETRRKFMGFVDQPVKGIVQDTVEKEVDPSEASAQHSLTQALKDIEASEAGRPQTAFEI